MDIKIPDELLKLNAILSPLYIVGGYVRNAIMGFCDTDIDVAGMYTPEEIEFRLKNSEFGAACVNKRLGTLKIFYNKNRSFNVEYTTFRRESYMAGRGLHTPESISFTRDIETDAMRRDFKINAVYYDITNKKLLDFTNGVADIENKIISTVREPQKVFSEDGLRLLRLVRQAAELGFKIEENTFNVAKSMVGLLNDISKERIRDEFMKILVADQKYPHLNLKNAHVRGVRLLDSLGALPYILPELLKGKNFKQDSKYHVYDVFEHNVHTFKHCPPNVRLAGLIHDIGKPASQKKYGNMYFHSELGANIVREELGRHGLKFPKSEINKIVRLILGHMYDLKGETREKKLRLFLVRNIDILPELIALKKADAIASKGEIVDSVSADRLEKLYKIMKQDGTPFCIKDLKINGQDLIDMGIPEKDRTKLLRKVFEIAVTQPTMRTRDEQLNCLKGLKNNG